MYATIAESDAYQLSNDNTAWNTFSDAKKTASLKRAGRYLDGVYAERFDGVPSTVDAEWPRTGAADRYNIAIAAGTIPVQIKNATFIVALYDLENPGTLWKFINPAEHVKMTKISVLRTEFFKQELKEYVILQEVEAVLRRLLSRVYPGPVVISS